MLDHFSQEMKWTSLGKAQMKAEKKNGRMSQKIRHAQATSLTLKPIPPLFPLKAIGKKITTEAYTTNMIQDLDNFKKKLHPFNKDDLN